MPLVAESIQKSQPLILAIVGPAGYGKSTILGELYDQARSLSTIRWIALARCNDLEVRSNTDLGSFAGAFSRELFGADFDLCCAVQSLTEQAGGRGLILIDTLDLIIERHTVPLIGRVFQELASGGATIALTCRDHEFSSFLEPVRERLPAISMILARHEIPEFSLEETEQAALAFVNRDREITRERGMGFVRSVLDVSVDNRPLREIVRNPLLLAMLCDLFGQEGNVPEDLTVSRLYNMFWGKTVATSRKHGPDSRIAFGKQELCETVARLLFDASRFIASESVAETDLKISANEILHEAYAELRSDGVLKKHTHGRVRFFHQTFGEYAIARWLATHAATRDRELLFSNLSGETADGNGLHWWPVIRLLLTIVDETEFYRLGSSLPSGDLASFRAQAYAAASRSEPGPLRATLTQAIRGTEAFQDTLRAALEGTANPIVHVAYEALVALIRKGHWGVTPETCIDIGMRAASDRCGGAALLDQALEAIELRPEGPSGRPADLEVKGQLHGWLLSGMERAACVVNPGDWTYPLSVDRLTLDFQAVE